MYPDFCVACYATDIPPPTIHIRSRWFSRTIGARINLGMEHTKYYTKISTIQKFPAIW